MRRLYTGIFVIIMITALLLAGCGGEKTTSPPTSAPATSVTASPAAGKATRLVFANWMQPPDVAKFSSTFETWASDFEKLTGGRYEVEVVHGGALASIPEAYDAVAKGIVDISHFIPQDTDRPFEMSNVVALPFLQVRSDTATKALHEVRKKGYFDKEYADVKLLFMNTSASADDLITIKQVNSLADLKGLKIGTGGGSRVDLLKGLGAVPVFCPPPEVYGMLQKGTIDGVLISGYGLYPEHTAEFLRYIINPIRMFRVLHVVAMNKDTYNRMPDDVKKIVDSMDAEAKYSLMGAKILADEYDEYIARFLKEVGKEVTLSQADTAVVEGICAEIFNKWISDMNAKGLPGKDIVADYYKALKDLGVQKPALGYPAK